MTEIYYFDTYALIEIYKSNPKYDKYTKDIAIILNRLNLLEYVHFLLRENRENETKEVFEKLSRFNVNYEDSDLIEAARMKFRYSKQKLSFIDCIGYILSRRYNAKFLTGDEKFKGKENVEFVKYSQPTK